MKEGDWREETAKVKKYPIQANVVDAFSDYRLENFDKVILRTHLNKLAKIHSKDRVLQIRSYMRAIFAEAVDQDFLAKDPARTVKTPANLREIDKTTLAWDRLHAALEKLDKLYLRDWILMKLEMSNALRPSELFPLRWRCFLEGKHTLDIQGMVRHSWTSTTMNGNMQSLETEVRAAVNSIHAELAGTGTTGPVPELPVTPVANAAGRQAGHGVFTQARSSTMERKSPTEVAEGKTVVPSRGKILQNAGK